MISFFKNRVQRYTFLRTQPNKMHKNREFVHKTANLCNNVSLYVDVKKRLLKIKIVKMLLTYSIGMILFCNFAP